MRFLEALTEFPRHSGLEQSGQRTRGPGTDGRRGQWRNSMSFQGIGSLGRRNGSLRAPETDDPIEVWRRTPDYAFVHHVLVV